MKRPVLPFLLIALCVSAVLILMVNAGVLGLWQNRFSDTLYGGAPPLKNIAVIAIDDKSLQEIGRWPWSRHNYVALLRQLNQSRIIAFDVAFFEPSSAVEDEALGRAMRTAGNVIIPLEAASFDKQNGALGVKEWLQPISALENVTTGVINVFTDPDGVSRSIPTELDGQPSLALAIVEKFTGTKPSIQGQRMQVNYVGRPFSYRTYSFSDVTTGRVAPEEFKDNIVLVGATAPDLHDDYIVPTSWGRRMPGVEIHAHAVQTILSRRFLAAQSFGSTALLIILLSLAAAFLCWKFSELTATLVGIGVIIAIFIAGLVIYNYGTIINLVHLPLAVLLTGAFCMIWIARSEGAHKKHILSVFGRYVSKDVVEHLLKGKESLELGGQERDISALFVDIRGFTAISEKLKPHQVITFLNHYFGHMTDIVFKNNGTLDKFIGDSIMAVFNSPQNDPDHAYNAVKTAVGMQEACKKLQKEGLPAVKIGIGITTGKAVVGNMGSEQRQEFTALGDTVNTASRLCGAADGGQTLIDSATYELVKDRVDANKLPPMKVKGKEKALTVYEVTGMRRNA
jgi:adenylate cyclase